VEEARGHDPLVEFGRYLAEHEIVDDAGQEALRAAIKTEIDGHIAAAWEAADPDPATSLKHVFAEDA
jgi:TPP-dependent pyruvate/acetoin dehydrogenase alpha subunit